MSFSSRHVFHGLIAVLRPDVICDVGSCDGQQALRFKRQRPSARVIAFEASPANAQRIRNDPRLMRRGIRVEHLAVTDEVGEAVFYVLEQRDDLPWATGASSLSVRTDEATQGLSQSQVTVPTTTLSSYLSAVPGRIALWIDVEGAADRVIAGMRDVANRVVAVHVEVEVGQVAQIWEHQTSADAAVAALAEEGFRLLGSDSDWPGQRNLVFVRADQTAAERIVTVVAARTGSAYAIGRGLLHRFRAIRRGSATHLRCGGR
jgi:FkbM family methyltransferase